MQSIRLSYSREVSDSQIVWTIQLYRSARQLAWCLDHLRRHYPSSRIVLIADGDDESYEAIADRHRCELVHGEHLMTLATSHRFVGRLLEVVGTGREDYLMKIDPDTRVWRRLRELPDFTSLFGTLETISEGQRDEIGVPANVQGGCMGITRDAAQAILKSGVLNEENCAKRYVYTWARCADMVLAAAAGRCVDDFILSWAASQVGIPIVESSEIRSRWRRRLPNGDLRFAITHPHKIDDPRTPAGVLLTGA